MNRFDIIDRYHSLYSVALLVVSVCNPPIIARKTFGFIF